MTNTYSRTCPNCQKSISYTDKSKLNRANKINSNCRKCAYENIRKPLEQRFWSKVKKTDYCWEFIGYYTKNGYGMIRNSRGKMELAHRISWKLHNESIPERKECCHICDNRRCVNPAHLFIGSHADNMRDMINKERFYKKLTSDDVIFIRNSKLSQKDLAKKFNIDNSNVSRIKCRKTWKHIS